MVDEFLSTFSLKENENIIAKELIRTGNTYAGIAKKTNFSPYTARDISIRVYRFVGVSSRNELQALYIQYLENKLEGR